MAISTSRAVRHVDEHYMKYYHTSENVAPGTYSNTYNEPHEPPGELSVPFNSMQEKKLNHNSGTSAITPGPGAFNPQKNPAGPGIGYTALKARRARMGPVAKGSTPFMESTSMFTPGPGSYDTPLEESAAKELMRPAMPVLDAAEKTTPSIPIRRLLPHQAPDPSADDNDVEMTAMVMRHTGETKDVVGPGEYSPGGRFIVSANIPQTTFYASKVDRALWEPSGKFENQTAPREVPPPGTYETTLDLAKKRRDDEYDLPTWGFSSKSLMGYQKQVRDDRVLPGPGNYEKEGEIDRRARSARDHSSHRGELSQFDTLVERAGWARDLNQPYTDAYHLNHVPGPGHYPRPSTFPGNPKAKDTAKVLPSSMKKTYHGVHHPNIIIALQLQDAEGPMQAFNSTDDRYCNKEIAKKTPGPTEYLKEQTLYSSIDSDLKERAKIGKNGIFGSCADRFYGSPLAAKEGPNGADPAGDHNNPAYTDAHTEPKVMFKSQTPRFNAAAGPQEVTATPVKSFVTPAPGNYDIEKVANYRSPFRPPRNDHLSFGSCEHRFDKRDVFSARPSTVGHTPSRNNPGPGDYESTKKKPVRGFAKGKSDRPKPYVGCTNEKIGPGSYSNMETTLLKKTFNVTTQGSVSAPPSARGVVRGRT